MRKYASAEERAAKKQKMTVRHFGFTEKVYMHGSHIVIVEAPSEKCHRGNVVYDAL